MTSSHSHHVALILILIVLLTTLQPNPANAQAQTYANPLQGCTTLYAYDGQTALGGNNEDFNNPLTRLWFIPASPGRFGRVYFGYDDYLPQGGLNDQGVFFDSLALPYKETPVNSQKPHFPDGDLALADEILSRSANVQDAVKISSQWTRLGGGWAQDMYGDRFGDSVIIDGDTVLRKQGSFQLATNFRLADYPNPPYPEGNERYVTLSNMLSQADHFSVDLFRQALDAAHAEGDYPTIYSQIYELKTGTIHLYQYHNFQQEVVLNLADELAKGPHILTIASLFPRNDDLEQWTAEQVSRWKASYSGFINTDIEPSSQGWMSGQYVLQGEAQPAKVYLKEDQLYLQVSNQLPINLYPREANTVFHHFFNGIDLTLTFQRNLWGQASQAQGTFSFDPYEIAVPYNLTRTDILSFNTSIWIAVAGLAILLVSILFILRKRRLIG